MAALPSVPFACDFRCPFPAIPTALLTRLDRPSLFPVGSCRQPLTSRCKALPDSSALLGELAVTFSDDFPWTLTSGIVLLPLFGFGVFRAFVYFRIQYIIASMLGKYVPRGGSRVLDLDIHEGRNLYYYPSDIVEVIAIAEEKNYEVVKNQAIRAGVLTDVKLKAINTLSLPSNSIDAVVSVYCLCGVDDKQAKTILREAVRILKPGKPFIFVENVEADAGFLQACQTLLYGILKFVGIESNLPRDVSKYLQDVEGLENMEYEELFTFQDPHIVGLAFKCIEATNKSSKTRRTKKSIST